MNYTHGMIEGISLHWKQHGRTYRILAIREGADAANRLMEKQPKLAVLATVGESVVMADKTDQGVPFGRPSG